MDNITEIMFTNALDIVEAIQAKGIVVYAEVFNRLEELRKLAGKCRVFVVTRTDEDYEKAEKIFKNDVIRIPNVHLVRNRQAKMALMIGCAHEVIRSEDLLVCVVGPEGSKRLDTIMAVGAGMEYEMFGSSDVTRLIAATKNEVFERVIGLASKIAIEGREGHPVGTTFVVGDYDNVAKYTKQMIINPFKGYPAKSRNILDPQITETIRGFSMLDGAFIIKGNGTVVSGGTYLSTDKAEVDLPPGLGARHQAAAAITVLTSAVSIVISQSTGTISIFSGGKLILDIEKPRKHGAL